MKYALLAILVAMLFGCGTEPQDETFCKIEIPEIDSVYLLYIGIDNFRDTTQKCYEADGSSYAPIRFRVSWTQPSGTTCSIYNPNEYTNYFGCKR